MTRWIRLLVLTLAMSFAGGALAAFGDRDCSFGVNGVQTLPGSFGPAFDAVAEPAGTVLVRSGFLSTGSILYRMDANGTTATSLGLNSDGGLMDPADVLQPDGGILFSLGRGGGAQGELPGVARRLSTGALDTAFGTGGYAAFPGFTNAATGPLLQTDGHIVVGGTATNAALVRFTASGAIDTTFGAGGIATNPAAGTTYISIALQPDGGIVALGTTTLSRHNTDGSLDAAFGTAGTVNLGGVLNTALQVRAQPSGSIIVVGKTTAGSLRIVRLTAGGALDTTVPGGLGYRDVQSPGGPGFLAGSQVFPSIFSPLSLMSDGRPIVGGQVLTVNASAAGALVRYGADLSDDASVPLDFVPSFAYVLPSGRILVGTSGNGSGLVHRLLGDTDPASCITTATALTSAPNPSSYQQAVTLTATVTPVSSGPAQGSVQFKLGATSLGTVALTNGVASMSISTLAEGGNTLTAIYLPTGVFLGSTSPPYVHTVTPRTPTSTSVASSLNPSYFGQSVTLTASVAAPGLPTGTVQFRNNGSTLGSPVAVSGGIAALTTSALSTGSHSLTAVYSGDVTFAPSTSAVLTQTVLPAVTINDPSANPAAGPTTMTFTVTLTGPSTATVTVDYATQDHTALAGIDYTASAGTVTFAPGETSKTVGVPIMGQTVPAPTRDFFLTLSNPVNTALAKGAGLGTINYVGSGALSIFIDDPAVEEGNAGITLMGFALSLSQPYTAGTVTVSYATANGTASAGVDYTAQSGTVTFARGQTHRWIVVPLISNMAVDGNRTLFVNLSNPVGGSAVVAKSQGTGTIVDDDPSPPAATTPVYRLYSDATKEHLYTTDANEYSVLGTRGWTQEGRAWTIFHDGGTFGTQNTIPLYRMYNPFVLQHHWTTDANEVMVLSTYGSWDYEGISGYVLPAPDTGTTPLYRLMYRSPPLHLWTIDANEMTVLSTSQGWVYEGSVGEVLP